MRVTAKERILLHLLECGRFEDAAEVPSSLDQQGVARGAGVLRRHVAQFVRPLIVDGLISERTAHVVGVRQRRKVYELTSAGRVTAIRLRESVKKEPIRVRDGDLCYNGTLGESFAKLGSEMSFVEAVRQVQDFGVLDLRFPRRSPDASFVEQLADAPRVGTFLGRREELAELTHDAAGPQVFVVRGIAGIGKSTLAAKACELLRGKRNLFWHRIRPWESDLAVLAALGRFLEALDRPGLTAVLKRGDRGAIPEVLREDLFDTRAFLVLDDAHEATAAMSEVLRMLMEVAASAPDIRMAILTRRALSFYDVRDTSPAGAVREIELRNLKPEEAAAFLSTSGLAELPSGLARRIAGHPLFLELIRACHPIPGKGLQSIRRFIEEEVYRILPEPERVLMKAACLYEVPVPQSVLLSVPGCSYETLLSLQDRALIWAVGGERYEVHDTIREFLRGILSPSERGLLGDLAVAQLRGMASTASESGDFVGCINSLSNALLLARSSQDRLALSEALGDADERIGDVLGCAVAYRQAMKLADEPETLARLHRKMAAAYVQHGETASADREIDEGLRALERLSSVERGWLELLRAQTFEINWEDFRSEDCARRALSTFERVGNLPGQARASLALADASDWTGSTLEDGSLVSDGAYDSALKLAEKLGDEEFAAEVHLMLSQSIGFKKGNFEEVAGHLEAVRRSSSAWSNPFIRARFYHLRAIFLVRLKMDFEAAEADLLEVERLAGRIHQARYLGQAMSGRGAICHDRGRHEEARCHLEKAAAQFVAAGLTGHALDAYAAAAFEALEMGDSASFRRVVTNARGVSTEAKEINRVRGRVLEAFSALVRGDPGKFDSIFGKVFQIIDDYPPTSGYQQFERWWIEFSYSVGLRASGRESEASEHFRRAIALAQAANFRRALLFMKGPFATNVIQSLRASMS